MGVASSSRLPGPDVTRATAMLGVVVMNYHGFRIIAGNPRSGDTWLALFDPWTGPLATRFAATFVLTAGIGVSLLCAPRRHGGDPQRIRDLRYLMLRRGLVLYVAGLLFELGWPGTILPYYGAMFALAAMLFTWPRWALGGVAVAATAAGWVIEWRAELARDAGEPHPFDGLPFPLGHVADVVVFGTHPLVPWLAFFVVGMIVGRSLAHPAQPVWAIGLGIALVGVAALSGGPTDPYSRSGVYTASALGSALAAYGLITMLVRAVPDARVVRVLQQAGRASLTVYIGHAAVYLVLVTWLQVFVPQSLVVTLGFAVSYWAVASMGAAWAVNRFGIGPAELVYRVLAPASWRTN